MQEASVEGDPQSDGTDFGSSHFLSNGTLLSRVAVGGSFSFASWQAAVFMPRKGWSVMPTPAGWFEVIRGPRPPSVQWPPGKGKGKTEDSSVQPAARGRWQHGLQTQVGRWKRGGGHVAATQSSSKVRSLEAALAALGPEESSAKTEITVALQRAREQDTPQVRFDPEARVAAGRDRVARLEQAISVLGDLKGLQWMLWWLR